MAVDEVIEEILSGDFEPLESFYFLALALILAFGTINTAGTALQTDKPVVSVVSCSMYPAYHKGDILVVQGEKFSDIEVGEVVVYKVPDRIDFSINGKEYTLEKNSPTYNKTVQTSIGKIKLLEATSVLQNSEAALLSIDGEKVRVDEGFDTTVNGHRLDVERISAMPIPVVHRVISKNKNYLQTKGDANSRQLDFESSVRPFQIHGTAKFKIPKLGALKILAMDFVGFQGDKPFVFDVYSPCR